MQIAWNEMYQIGIKHRIKTKPHTNVRTRTHLSQSSREESYVYLQLKDDAFQALEGGGGVGGGR